MALRAVTLTNVRAHAHLAVDLRGGLNILVGSNGAGKTTVLEAIALVLRGSVLRPGPIRDLIRQGQDFLRIEIDVEGPGGRTTAAAAAYTRGGDRRLTADGTSLQDASRWKELVPLRTFVPDDLRMVKGGPHRRRDYLDALAGRGDAEYGVALQQYEQALAQRNALLRGHHHGLDDEQIVPWERILAHTGATISQKRAARLGAFVGSFAGMYTDLTGEPSDSIRLVYRSNVSGLEAEEYERRLREMRSADRQRTFTHLGPHRDDLRLVRRGLDMRDCASQGEQRAALLTMVLAEWAQGGEGHETANPLLLLDDVMSELDEGRRRALVQVMGSGDQTIVTTTDLRYFSEAELSLAHVVDIGTLS